MKVSAPTIKIIPIKRIAKIGVLTSNVPDDGGEYFFIERLPAIPKTGIIIANRPMNIAIASMML